MSPREQLAIENDEGEEVVLPSRYEVCERCQGKGVHDHPAFSNGITAEDWNGPDWDDDSRESYLHGDYDVPCSVCDGKRVVLVPDEDAMSAEQKALWAAHEQAMYELRRDEASERRWMGDY